MWRNRSFRKMVPKPWEARAAKYWQVSAKPSPATPKSTISPPMRRIYPVSPVVIPTSMMRAMTKGTISSKMASISLKRGPKMTSFLKCFK